MSWRLKSAEYIRTYHREWYRRRNQEQRQRIAKVKASYRKRISKAKLMKLPPEQRAHRQLLTILREGFDDGAFGRHLIALRVGTGVNVEAIRLAWQWRLLRTLLSRAQYQDYRAHWFMRDLADATRKRRRETIRGRLVERLAAHAGFDMNTWTLGSDAHDTYRRISRTADRLTRLVLKKEEMYEGNFRFAA